jgi:inner membrane protein involved in colicin E2 resistance
MNSPTLHRHATVLKLLGILVLVALLQIPLWFINGLLRERAERRDTALAEITDTWGRSQQITGPFLVVPYRTVATAGSTPSAATGASTRPSFTPPA